METVAAVTTRPVLISSPRGTERSVRRPCIGLTSFQCPAGWRLKKIDGLACRKNDSAHW
jgi:hypothetical protein